MKAISAALVKAQSQFKPVAKDSENPFFKSNYADLSSILQAVMPVLTSNGLALSQPMKVVDGVTILCTNLIHESGEMMTSEMILPVVTDPQKYGSLITYYKRYQLQAMLGVSTADDDDDANFASQKSAPPKPANNYKTEPPSEAQLKAIAAICNKKGIPRPDIKTNGDAFMWINEQNKGR